MVDVRGKEIKQGDLIAYPVRTGSLMVLKLASVAEVRANDIVCHGENRRIVIKVCNRCVIVG